MNTLRTNLVGLACSFSSVAEENEHDPQRSKGFTSRQLSAITTFRRAPAPAAADSDIGAFDYLRPELTQSGKRELNPHGQND